MSKNEFIAKEIKMTLQEFESTQKGNLAAKDKRHIYINIIVWLVRKFDIAHGRLDAIETEISNKNRTEALKLYHKLVDEIIETT